MAGASKVVHYLLGVPGPELNFGELDRASLEREGLWTAAIGFCIAQGEEIPHELKREFVERVAWELGCRRTMLRLGEVASECGLTLVICKGASLALSVYNPGQRSFGDVDICCSNAPRANLIQFLQGQGGALLDRPCPEVVLERIRFDVHSHPLGQLADFLEIPGESWVELARPVLPDCCSLLGLAPEHEFLLALFHGAKHCFFRANWVVDVAALANRVDANLLSEAVRRHRAGWHLWLAQQCLQEWFDLSLPADLLPAASSPPAWDLVSGWLKKRVLNRTAPSFLGMLTPIWAISSPRRRYAYLKNALFPPGVGFVTRSRHLVDLLRELLS